MNRILCFLLIAVFSSCLKKSDTVESYGTQLQSIKYQKGTENWTAPYHYNEDGMISSIENAEFEGRRYDMEYKDGKLLQYHTYLVKGNNKVFTDSLAYNDSGQLERIYHYSDKGDTSGLSLSWVQEYEYDTRGILEKMTTTGSNAEVWRIQKFHWEDGNLTREEHYDEGGALRYEFFYFYDNKINYKQDIPIYVAEPVNWSENNLTLMDWKDHYGNLDMECRPCETQYNYNLSDYPVMIKKPSGVILELDYD